MVHTSGGGQWDGGTDNSSVADNTWYHLVITQDGTSPKVWLGALGSAITDQTNGVSGDSDETAWFEASWNALKIGENQAGSGGRLNGGIAEFACWNVVLTNSQISDLHNSSGNGVSASTIPVGLRVLFNFDVNGEVDNKALSGGISDLPENTLFEETDTYKTFWLQDNIWKDPALAYEGGVAYNIAPPTYASTSGWVDDNDDIALDTVNKGITFTDVDSAGDIGRDLNVNLGTSWVCKFHFNLSELNGNDSSLIAFTSDYTTHWNTSANEVLIVQVQGASYWRFVFILQDEGTWTETATSNNTFALNTTYYITVSRNGDTVTETIRTGSHTGSVAHTLTRDVSGLTLDMDGIQHYSRLGGSGDMTGYVRGVYLKNGVTSF